MSLPNRRLSGFFYGKKLAKLALLERRTFFCGPYYVKNIDRAAWAAQVLRAMTKRLSTLLRKMHPRSFCAPNVKSRLRACGC